MACGPATPAACFDGATSSATAASITGSVTLAPTTPGTTTTTSRTAAVGYDPNQPYWLHRVRFEHGSAAWYGNKWVDTPLTNAKAEFGEFDRPPGTTSSQSNVSVFWHGGRLLSLGEVGWPYELDPTDLSTIGPVELSGPGGVIGPNITAPPKRDPATGLLHFFGCVFTPGPLNYYVASPDGRQLVSREEIPVTASTMIHNFAITEKDLIFWEMPVVSNLQTAIEGSNNPFEWTPSYGSRLGILPRGGPSTDMTWVEIENGYVFHGTNAHRDGERIVLDISKLPSMFAGGVDGPSLLPRWDIDLSGTTPSVKETTLDADVPMDLPEIDGHFTGRPPHCCLVSRCAHDLRWQPRIPRTHTTDGHRRRRRPGGQGANSAACSVRVSWHVGAGHSVRVAK